MSEQFTISEDQIERAIGVDRCRFTVPCEWLDDVAQQFETIANLPEGWDTYGAPRPDIRILNSGWWLLLSLCRACAVPRPHVNPTRTGGIQFEWEDEARYFEIEIIDETAAGYFYRDDDMALEEEGELSVGGRLGDVLEYIRRFGAARGSQLAEVFDSQSFLECERFVEAPA